MFLESSDGVGGRIQTDWEEKFLLTIPDLGVIQPGGAEILQSGPVPATFLRAAMILGSGSASFEILRYLVDRLPIMVTPRWVHNPVQPIAIRNVLNYLQGCLEHEETRGQTFDIGGAVTPEWTYCGDTSYAGGTVLECSYSVQIQATPEEVWQPIIRMGGETGYYFGNYLWRLRGWIDRLLGGIGFRGGRRHPLELRVGDALDFWRVLEVEPPHRLLLLAEMKLPGEAVLEFHLTPQGDGQVELIQTARFLPRGLAGIGYWYSLVPFHQWVQAGRKGGVGGIGGFLRK